MFSIRIRTTLIKGEHDAKDNVKARAAVIVDTENRGSGRKRNGRGNKVNEE